MRNAHLNVEQPEEVEECKEGGEMEEESKDEPPVKKACSQDHLSTQKSPPDSLSTMWYDTLQESQVIGMTHSEEHDTTKKFDDITAVKKFFGREVPRIHCLSVYHNEEQGFVHGYEVHYVNEFGQSMIIKRIGGEAHFKQVKLDKTTLTLEDGEVLTGVKAQVGWLVDRICFTTSKGRKMRAGGSGGVKHAADVKG